MHGFPKTFIHPPQRIPYKDRIPQPVDDFGDFTSSEVCKMNKDHQEEQRFWREEHQ